jgi:hypothetical protein
VSDSDPLQQKTVKPTAPPEDTHSVQPTAPGTNVEPRSTQVGNFAEKNFNGLTDMVLDQGIPANGTGSGRIPRGKVISGAIPAGAEPKYKIEGWKGTAPGGRELEIDFLDRAAGEVIEIKPDNRYDEGMSKAKFYSETMDKVDPLPDVKLPDGTIERQRWKPKCETYDGEAVGALHDYLFRQNRGLHGPRRRPLEPDYRQFQKYACRSVLFYERRLAAAFNAQRPAQ